MTRFAPENITPKDGESQWPTAIGSTWTQALKVSRSAQRVAREQFSPGGPCPKSGISGKRQANTGSAGALARYERKARNIYSVKRFEIERAAHARAGDGARAPSINWLVPDGIDLLGKAGLGEMFFRKSLV